MFRGRLCWKNRHRTSGTRLRSGVPLLLAAWGLMLLVSPAGWGQQMPSIQDLQAEIARLRGRVAELESLKAQLSQLDQQLKELQKALQAQKPSVEAANKQTKIVVVGRTFVGAFSTQTHGSFANRSLDIPDSKIGFAFSPSPYLTIVNRFSANRAAVGGFDYFYADLKDYGGAWPGHTLRIGKHKLDIGQETWTDNPVESIVVTNAVSHVSGYDEGVNLRGPLRTGSRPWTYSIELVNGTQGFTEGTPDLTWGIKVGGLVTEKAHVSFSYFRTGNLVKRDGTVGKPDFNIAEMFDPPTGATGWRRSLWEIDLRYGYGRDGIKSIVGREADEPWQLALAYGRFNDDAEDAPDRKGSYGLVEALFNLTPRAYLGLRFSQISLDDGVIARLADSPVAVNRYRRYSFGLGYRLSRLTHIKTEYTVNDTDGGATDPRLNQFAVGIATNF